MNSTPSTRVEHKDLETLFTEALERFPYPLDATSITQGELTSDDPEAEIEYSEEFIFTVGKLFNETLQAGGWIDVRREPGEPVFISGLFGVARDDDWKDGSILPECVGVHASYDLETKTWELWIDSY